jgi:hypothetical protein
VTCLHPEDEREPAVTRVELGSLVRAAVEQIRPEAEEVMRQLDDLEKVASELEACGDAVYEPGSSAGDLLAVMACHLPNELQAVTGNMRNIRELLNLPATVVGNL